MQLHDIYLVKAQIQPHSCPWGAGQHPQRRGAETCIPLQTWSATSRLSFQSGLRANLWASSADADGFELADSVPFYDRLLLHVRFTPPTPFTPPTANHRR